MSIAVLTSLLTLKGHAIMATWNIERDGKNILCVEVDSIDSVELVVNGMVVGLIAVEKHDTEAPLYGVEDAPKYVPVTQYRFIGRGVNQRLEADLELSGHYVGGSAMHSFAASMAIDSAKLQ